MKQTNYHLFDFMDFDPTLSKAESLWKAYAPTSVTTVDGDIYIALPYQKQLLQEDMTPDNETPQQVYTLVIRAYKPDILRLYTSMTGDELSEQSAMLQMSAGVEREPLHIQKEGDVYTILDESGRTRAVIDTRQTAIDHWSDLLPPPQPAPNITLFPDSIAEKGISLSDDHFSPPRYDALPIGFCAAENGNERATISFKCDADECFVGTGERFRKMDLSGQTFQLKNQDGQGVNNRRCYKNVPFFLSSRMYGVFYHTSDYCKLSLADHSTRSVQFLCDRATLDVFLIGGQTPERILRNYRMLTGFPPMLPRWSFGIWMSRMTYFSAEEVEEICTRMRKEQYPCDVIHLDTGWFRTDWLCEWKFNPERFPDPAGFIKKLKDDGFRVSLWQLPYVAEGAEQLAAAKSNRYISGIYGQEDANSDATEPTSEENSSNFSALDYAGTIDFTYDKATKWYQLLLKRLLDLGVACIKTDFGENIHMNHQYHALTPERLNNIYAVLYQKAAYEITKDVTGDGIVWARAAWAGSQRYPLHWGGDSQSSWDGMAGSLKGGLHFGLSGFAFWSHDVPGFHSTPDFMNSPLDEQVYVRWTQFGVFSSHMRYHGTCKREPWHYPSIAPIVKRWWQLRYRLLPYVLEQAEKSTRTGWPMIRALLMHHPQDRTCWHIDDEYYFGDAFLVAPVMNSAGMRDIYLPKGLWIDFFTGERYEGERWYYGVETPLERMPVFVRPGEHIRIYPETVACTDEMDPDRAVFLEIGRDFKGILHMDSSPSEPLSAAEQG
ncbi:MAG: alpha-xylosidase [Prevotella sp.]|nr:alpha-xylosidase [Prevotella sp.]